VATPPLRAPLVACAVDWAAPPPAVSPCGPVVPQCHRCGKPGPNCPVRVTVDVRTGVRTLWYCGVD
jgi:hypothetical protein